MTKQDAFGFVDDEPEKPKTTKKSPIKFKAEKGSVKIKVKKIENDERE